MPAHAHSHALSSASGAPLPGCSPALSADADDALRVLSPSLPAALSSIPSNAQPAHLAAISRILWSLAAPRVSGREFWRTALADPHRLTCPHANCSNTKHAFARHNIFVQHVVGQHLDVVQQYLADTACVQCRKNFPTPAARACHVCKPKERKTGKRKEVECVEVPSDPPAQKLKHVCCGREMRTDNYKRHWRRFHAQGASVCRVFLICVLQSSDYLTRVPTLTATRGFRDQKFLPRTLPTFTSTVTSTCWCRCRSLVFQAALRLCASNLSVGKVMLRFACCLLVV